MIFGALLFTAGLSAQRFDIGVNVMMASPIGDGNITADGYLIDQITIYTFTGQRVLQERPTNGTIDISHLQPGMYIVEVTVEKTKFRQKLLVQR